MESPESDSDSASTPVVLYIIYSANGIPSQLCGIPGVNRPIFASLASDWVNMLWRLEASAQLPHRFPTPGAAPRADLGIPPRAGAF